MHGDGYGLNEVIRAGGRSVFEMHVMVFQLRARGFGREFETKSWPPYP